MGVVAPGADAAVAAARASDRGGVKGPIAVLATEATVASDAYGRAIRALDPERDVVHTACPLFVPLAEEGWTENEVARSAAARYLADVPRAGARVVVLGCTHYPLLARTIAGALPEARFSWTPPRRRRAPSRRPFLPGRAGARPPTGRRASS